MSKEALKIVRLHNNKNLFVSSVEIEPIHSIDDIKQIKKNRLSAIKSIAEKEMHDLQDDLLEKRNEYYHLCNELDRL